MACLGPVQATLVTLGLGLEPHCRSEKSSCAEPKESVKKSQFFPTFAHVFPVGLAVDQKLARDEAHLRRDLGLE